MASITLFALLVLSQSQPKADLSAEQWRKDMRFLQTELPKRQLDHFKIISERDWNGQFEELDRNLDKLDDAAVRIKLAAIVSSLGVSHTLLDINGQQYRRYPVRYIGFSDGLSVIGATEEHKDLAGARIASVDGTPAREVVKKLSTIRPSENDYWAAIMAGRWADTGDALFAVGVAKRADQATFVFETTDGKKVTKTLEARLESWPLESLVVQDDLPQFLRSGTEKYRWHTLPEKGVMVVDYRQCMNDVENPFPEFAKEVMKEFDEQKLDTFVVDLRVNGGGNSRVIKPLLDVLRQRKELVEKKRVFALTSYRTFSSAMMNAYDLRKLGATLIGEPTGGNPNSYGEQKWFQLPESGLRVHYCTKYFRVHELEGANTIKPDVFVPLHWSDSVRGRDLAMEKVFELIQSTQKSL